jgi:hypothetical protein
VEKVKERKIFIYKEREKNTGVHGEVGGGPTYEGQSKKLFPFQKYLQSLLLYLV